MICVFEILSNGILQSNNHMIKILKRHGDAKTSELDKTTFLGHCGFSKFCSVLEHKKFHKITSFIK